MKGCVLIAGVAQGRFNFLKRAVVILNDENHLKSSCVRCDTCDREKWIPVFGAREV